MSTATLAPKPQTIQAEPETRLVLDDVPWELYERLRELPGSRNIRMTFDRGRLELMSPSQPHEQYAVRFEHMIVELSRHFGFSCNPLRTTTWKKPEQTGKEADACFYLANAPRVRKKIIKLSVDPPPDLAIEVELSPSSTDIESIYTNLRVPEIWRFDGQSLRILVLQADGTYRESTHSPSLPFLPSEAVLSLLREAEDLDDHRAWMERVAQWARKQGHRATTGKKKNPPRKPPGRRRGDTGE